MVVTGTAKEVKVGLFGIGLETYWPQFKGLHDTLCHYLNHIETELVKTGAEVVNSGLVDTPLKAQETSEYFKKTEVDIIFLYITTYALSSTVLPIIQGAKVPVIVLNLQPEKAIDYQTFNAMNDRTQMTGEWLRFCQACTVPEIANVFLRSGIPFQQITGTLTDDPLAWNEIYDYLDAAKVARALRVNRVGLLGHYYCGMLDIYSDLTVHSAQLGTHFELLEMAELLDKSRTVSPDLLERKVNEIHEYFDIQSDCSETSIRQAAQTAVGLDHLVQEHQLGALAYFVNGTGDERYVDLISSVIVGNSLLTANGVPVAGEYEVKNVQAMKILDLFGIGGSFTEFYAMDFNDDIVLMGHDGPGHIKIAEGKTKLRALKVYHGKVGQGLSVEMSVKHGPVTLLALVDAPDGQLKFLVAEGESVPGPILEIGNTNSRYRFATGARKFIDVWCQHGPAHHCAIGVGHIAHKLEKLGKLMNIQTIVCTQ